MGEYIFDKKDWEYYLDSCADNSVLSAYNLLKVLAKDDDEAVMDALDVVENKHILLDLTGMSLQDNQSTIRERLYFEENFVRNGANIDILEENDPLRICLMDIPDIVMDETTVLQSAKNDLESLFMSGMRRAARISFEYVGKGVLLADLLQEANLALWNSISGYISGDYMSYTEYAIRSAIIRSIFLQARNDGIESKITELLSQYKTARQRLLRDLGREPAPEVIAEYMHLNPELIFQIQKMIAEAEALSQITAENQTPEDASEEDLAVEDTAYYKMRERISDLLSQLSEMDAQILSMRYGLDRKLPMSVGEVAEKMGITAEEVQSRESVALQSLRTSHQT